MIIEHADKEDIGVGDVKAVARYVTPVLHECVDDAFGAENVGDYNEKVHELGAVEDMEEVLSRALESGEALAVAHKFRDGEENRDGT